MARREEWKNGALQGLCAVHFLPWWGEASRRSIPKMEVVGNDRQSGAIDRLCSSTKVHQWSFSSRLEILRTLPCSGPEPFGPEPARPE